MTEKKDESTESTASESLAPESADADSGESSNAETPEARAATQQQTRVADSPKRKSRTMFRVITSIVVIAAVGAAGYYGWLQLRTQQRDAQAEQIAALQQQIRRQSEQVDLLHNQVTALNSDKESMQREIRRGSGDVDKLTQRLSEAERNMSALRGISDSSRNTLLLAEARYFLELATNRLRLETDPVSAAAALEAASQRLAATADPAYNPVLALIQEESESLDAVVVPDIGDITASLSEVSILIDGLPLRGNVPDGTTDERAALDDETGLDRAMSAVGNAFKDMFRVRRIDEQVMPLMTPDQEYFLRQNLLLKIEAARLAAHRRDAGNFESSLSESIGWIESYFDKNDPDVSGALATLTELSTLELNPELPAISGSLTLLERIGFAGEGS